MLLLHIPSLWVLPPDPTFAHHCPVPIPIPISIPISIPIPVPVPVPLTSPTCAPPPAARPRTHRPAAAPRSR